MMKRQRSVLILFLLAIIILITPSCKEKKLLTTSEKSLESTGPVVQQKEISLKKGKRGGTFVRADIPEVDTFNIAITRSKPIYELMKLVFDSLLTINPYTGEITGGIAKKFEISKDGLTVTLYLNDNVYFSDGKKCTADDVIFTVEGIYLNPEVASRKIDLLTVRNKTVIIDKVNDYVVKFTLPAPYRPFLYNLTQIEILPEHILEPKINEKGIYWFNTEWGSKGTDLKDLIGTGPYMIKDYKPGKSLTLVRNPLFKKREGNFYLEKAPYLDEIVELLNLDYETKILKFQIGELDFYDVSERDFDSGDFESLINNEKEGNYRLYYCKQTLRSGHFLSFNLNPEAVGKEKSDLFRNERFRKAVSICINREKISRELYHGYASIDQSPLRDVSPYYKSEGFDKFSPAEAQNIFEELGLTDKNNDGFLELPSGKPFSFTILTNSDNPLRVKMGNIIVDGLKKAGIKAELKSIDYDLLITKLLDTFEWESVIIGYSGVVEPNDLSWIWESSGPLHLWYPYQKDNLYPWEKRIDELFSMGRTEWDSTKASAFYHEFQDIAYSKLPIINIVVPYEIYGYRNGYGNIYSSPVTYNSIGIMPYVYMK